MRRLCGALLLVLSWLSLSVVPAQAQAAPIFEAIWREAGPLYQVRMFGIGDTVPTHGRMIFSAHGFHVEVLSQHDVLDCTRVGESVTCTGIFQSTSRPEVLLILTPLAGTAGPQPQSAQLRLDDGPDGGVGTILNRDFVIDLPPLPVLPSLTVAWGTPGRATATWQAPDDAVACLWRAQGLRPAYSLSCTPGAYPLGPGSDAQQAPWAGDVYEVRDKDSRVLARATLPPYATITLPIMARP